MHEPDKALRILVMANLPWDARLGAVRVCMEIAEQWRAAGHQVTQYSLSEAFSGAPTSSASLTFRQILFPFKAAAFVRKNAANFDIIDALIGVLPFSKKKLGFDGLIVARSVGLYRLFDQFDLDLTKKWPERPKGKLIGRIFYSLARRRLLKASDRAVRAADLINLPNEEEATCLRREVGTSLPILVQPYGLTDERRAAFRDSATSSDARLNQLRVCFIGMWGARKGARDWAEIIRRIRQSVPGVQFRFLGTMIDSSVIWRDLQLDSREGIELVPSYQSADLPGLLADCAVGAFPSYAEGFGLGVLEQLAAGIPTVAYDIAGPRDMLHGTLRELVVATGDVQAFANKISQILQLRPNAHAKLADQCSERASEFSWPAIAESTLTSYRSVLEESSTRKILFVQPFGLGSAGGGPRILRALLERAPFAWESICTSPGKPPPWPNERHLRSRPDWGRIERTRFAGVAGGTASFFASGFRSRLKKLCVELNARAIHAVPHAGLDFAEAHAVARELSLPFFISLHDDIAYTAAGGGRREERELAMRSAWQQAAARFVISEALAREYCERYGTRDYAVVTDGLTEVTPLRDRFSSEELRIYFMGLFHVGYETNLRAFLDGLRIFRGERPLIRASLTCRCEHIRAQVLDGAEGVTILPFASDGQVKRDMTEADLLYLPLPFGDAHEKFARYSLSTKMVSYAGSGVPILYHGPTSSAAYDLLKRHQAAILLTSLVPEEIAQTLGGLTHEVRITCARNALALAQRDFMLGDQERRFWSALERTAPPS